MNETCNEKLPTSLIISLTLASLRAHNIQPHCALKKTNLSIPFKIKNKSVQNSNSRSSRAVRSETGSLQQLCHPWRQRAFGARADYYYPGNLCFYSIKLWNGILYCITLAYAVISYFSFCLRITVFFSNVLVLAGWYVRQNKMLINCLICIL